MEMIMPHWKRLENAAAINAGSNFEKDKGHFSRVYCYAEVAFRRQMAEAAALPYLCHVAGIGAGDQHH